ncbi:hypothetical protein [Pantoea sp. WMus005]|uniref:hypothetical protein n=1 Tax=Pantoea sp. WMus005 TaxID=2750734 RepID=UPI0015D05BB5|nr:hypothetical protein [Pantoea sp. WMus005]NYS31332.1 hypothetical protein [Pantoea sp. WMus005]
MKKHYIFLFTLGGLFFAAIPLILYFIQFSPNSVLPDYLTERLSIKNDDWGSFGSFLSGTSGAIFSFFGTLAVIWTLVESHKSNEKQINMIRSEQTFAQFNELLKVLEEMLKYKIYPTHHGALFDLERWKDYVYSRTALKMNIFLNENPKDRKNDGIYEFSFYSFFYGTVMEEINTPVFNKESAIYTVLLDRIMNSDNSTKEALIAVLDAKLDEDLFFFLNAFQILGEDKSRIIRMLASSLPLQVPVDLSDRIYEFTD